MTPAEHQALIDDFTLSPLSLAELAQSHHMSVLDLARWAADPPQRAELHAIRDLSNTRTDLLVSHARTEAAHALRRLAAESASAETQRKACVDLLRLGLPPLPTKARAARPASDIPPDIPADADTARHLLEALTRHTGPTDDPSTNPDHASPDTDTTTDTDAPTTEHAA